MLRLKFNQIIITKGDEAAFRIHLFNGKEEVQPTETLILKVHDLLEKEAENGFFIIDPEDTAEADTGVYKAEIEYGSTQTVWSGVFVIEGEITNE